MRESLSSSTARVQAGPRFKRSIRSHLSLARYLYLSKVFSTSYHARSLYLSKVSVYFCAYGASSSNAGPPPSKLLAFPIEF
mmetsp:Transcript_29234/g.62067  ORF Transcript_29234/g.62067 Transcript_29234/m.62067 type:complete len:81 (-) Transcript_29234:1755-1997(-)